MKTEKKAYILIYIVSKDKEEARKICKNLLEERLVACANIIHKMESMYWWDGKIQNDQEVVLIVKTTKPLFKQVTKEIKKIHSYQCPCIIALPIVEGSNEYLSWIKDSVITK